VALGIGAIIGAGLFVRTAAAIAERAGPAVTLAFLVAAIGCAFAGLCYAEFASMIPIAGSAYTYSYATMGELMAWIIGWDLVLEYAVGAATVAIAWSEYFNRVLEYIGLNVPYQWRHSPFESADGVQGIMNIPAVFILILLTLLLIRGIRESAFVNGIIVIVKVAIVLAVIVVGWGFINPANHTPLIPDPVPFTTAQGVTHTYGGIMGILGARGGRVLCLHRLRRRVHRGAGSEEPEEGHAVRHSRLAHRVHDPLRAVLVRAERRGHRRGLPHGGPRGLGRLRHQHLHDRLRMAGRGGDGGDSGGFSSVILVMLLGQSRVFFAMSHDGLVPSVFSDVHPKFQTPWKSNLIFLVLTGIFAAFIPGDIVGEMTSIGTLFAFVLVCAGVWIMRRRRPDVARGFVVPMMPVVSTLAS
jgi:APA family basic amino acid/polyamine antiporter